MNFTVLSDIGKKRKINEDRANVFVRSDFVHMAIVADGMGGHAAGEVASEMAISYLEQAFHSAEATSFSSEEQVLEWLTTKVEEINSTIYTHSLTHEECNGMGTTLLVLILSKDMKILCHVGDSRAYGLVDHSLTQLTKDHSYVNILLEHGEISEEEAENHPQKNFIVRSLGTEKKIQSDIIPLTNQPFTRLLLCSDGLSNKLSDSELLYYLNSSETLETIAQALVNRANELGGEDNITLVILDIETEVSATC
ncbi:Stp1/IreP family PP2C-type Ser/Thr phosphatase [Paenisporosarcina cavernae]|uniref:protein-serine/threonine phosphatase n=1 Tax=Paenisporosarcina cavernae TaxID=2320858 RepID=A0A385YTF7_9BACL|nr:Stp1/IreP family PP2C-type Ser/Thr phosphatase [Paenisporosarcina cavernae]AYC29197.1 Stp1/IreP family PP2C-type Ser/Thr phosphatase [Paenisporosarcina cavernae]